MKIVLDPGHMAGYNPYAVKGYDEGTHMWDLANILLDTFKERGVSVITTRPKVTDNPGFEARGKMADGYDLFLSLHTNASGSSSSGGKARGTEVLYSTQKPNDKALAAKLSKAVSSLIGIPDRGAKCNAGKTSADAYGVFNGANKVNVPHMFILESAFHDNIDDCAWLVKPGNLGRLASTITNAICDIFGVAPKPRTRADYQAFIQAKCGFSDPAGVWAVIDKHAFADDLYRKWAESY